MKRYSFLAFALAMLLTVTVGMALAAQQCITPDEVESKGLQGAIINAFCTGALNNPIMAVGTTPGKVKTTADCDFQIGGVIYTKAATDDLFDMTALADLTTGEYQTVALMVDHAGTASIGEGTVSASAALALAAASFYTIPDDKCAVGYVAMGPGNDWDAEAITAHGSIVNGLPQAIKDRRNK
jgi:hypothetical protein